MLQGRRFRDVLARLLNDNAKFYLMVEGTASLWNLKVILKLVLHLFGILHWTFPAESQLQECCTSWPNRGRPSMSQSLFVSLQWCPGPIVYQSLCVSVRRLGLQLGLEIGLVNGTVSVTHGDGGH